MPSLSDVREKFGDQRLVTSRPARSSTWLRRAGHHLAYFVLDVLGGSVVVGEYYHDVAEVGVDVDGGGDAGSARAVAEDPNALDGSVGEAAAGLGAAVRDRHFAGRRRAGQLDAQQLVGEKRLDEPLKVADRGVCAAGRVVMQRTASRDSRELNLSAKELAVIEALLNTMPGYLSTETRLEQVWDENADPFTNTVSVTVGRLRRKLGEPPIIATTPGIGYRIVEPSG